MNEAIEEAMSKVVKTIGVWHDEELAGQHTHETAQTLEFQLTVLKLLIGIDKFDELPAFSRMLKEATSFNTAWYKAKEQKEKFAK